MGSLDDIIYGTSWDYNEGFYLVDDPFMSVLLHIYEHTVTRHMG